VNVVSIFFRNPSRSLVKTYPIAWSDVNERLILDVSNRRFDYLVPKTSVTTPSKEVKINCDSVAAIESNICVV